jgi:hypothetical protein
MNHYQNEFIYLVGWLTKPVANEQDTNRQLLAAIPQARTSLPGLGKNIFQAKVADKNSFIPLTAFDLQIRAEGIVLDQELIAECRSGEI